MNKLRHRCDHCQRPIEILGDLYQDLCGKKYCSVACLTAEDRE